ncbi:MAG: ArsR/SmtB family transcription factor [Promethearchaeota archaeon]
MRSQSDSLPLQVFPVLQDETRLAIYICLVIYQELTVKQLSDLLHKGKTTIVHHLRKMDDAGIVKWEEKEEDTKALKTRYFSLDWEIIKKRQEEPERKPQNELETMKTKGLVTSNLIEWIIQYQDELKDSQSFIKIVPLTPETVPIYQEAMRNIEEKFGKSSDSITHLSSHVFIPIKEILEWKYKQKTK